MYIRKNDSENPIKNLMGVIIDTYITIGIAYRSTKSDTVIG
jgi:hypothetical protein